MAPPGTPMPLHLDIDAHGRVVPQSDPARRALADRAGRFVLLPSAADLVVARRTPATASTSERPRCIVAGDLAAFPIADFIAFVHQSRLSGVLTVCAGGAERSVAFQDGEVRTAHSTVAGERIGEVVVRLGYATEAQVAEATAAAGPIGKALLERGVLKPNDLYKCLHEQVVAVFHALLLSKSGTFALVDEDPGERPAAPLSVSTQSLLMDGIRRIDELSLFKARIPGPDAFLRRREPPRPVTLRPTENGLLGLVDGRRTVAEIATAAHLNEFDATKILFHLAEAGYVEALAVPLAAASPAERVPAIVGGMNELLRAVASTIPAGGRAAFLDAAQAFLWDEANPWAPLVRGLPVAGDGGLDEAGVRRALAELDPAARAALDASGDPAKIALGALREALFFWLFLAGERIERDADEALGRDVKQRLARLEALAA
jgi:Domain of unknown function (DUF4388)